jgi:trk system potassium uptake protein TrkA
LKVVIVGAGEVGFHIAGRLALEKKDVVVIDRDPAAIRRVSDNIDAQVLVGSGSSPVVLEEAGIREAEILLAVTDSDEANLVACLAADIISPATRKLARIRNPDFDTYHDAFHAHAPHIDTVINPEIEVVKTIDRLMSVPGAVDVGEFADGRIKLIGIRLDQTARAAGLRLSKLPDLTEGSRLLVASIIRDEELIIPRGDDQLLPGDLIYLVCEETELTNVLQVFDKYEEPVGRVLIVGGGQSGFRLAAHLEKKSIYTKIIEKDENRCVMLAEQLNKAVVLQGDASDQALLVEENIGSTDVVVTLTRDEETNILVSLLAKKMGVRKAIAKINKFSYFPLLPSIGLEQIVSPRLSAINSILQHVRRGKVLSAISIKGEQAEVLEAVALETSDIVGKPLRNIRIPKGAIVAGIMRGDEVFIPSGASIVEPEDRIIFFAHRDAVPKIEKMLAVKLEFF